MPSCWRREKNVPCDSLLQEVQHHCWVGLGCAAMKKVHLILCVKLHHSVISEHSISKLPPMVLEKTMSLPAGAGAAAPAHSTLDFGTLLPASCFLHCIAWVAAAVVCKEVFVKEETQTNDREQPGC